MHSQVCICNKTMPIYVYYGHKNCSTNCYFNSCTQFQYVSHILLKFLLLYFNCPITEATYVCVCILTKSTQYRKGCGRWLTNHKGFNLSSRSVANCLNDWLHSQYFIPPNFPMYGIHYCSYLNNIIHCIYLCVVLKLMVSICI